MMKENRSARPIEKDRYKITVKRQDSRTHCCHRLIDSFGVDQLINNPRATLDTSI